MIVFVIYPLVNGRLDMAGMQIAVMDPDGKNLKKVTDRPGVKIFPSFSHSGRKIIYAGADTIRESGGTRAADFDAYEVDLESGRETRLTRFRFFQTSPPFYLPDDEQFIFAGEFPRACPRHPYCNYEAMMKAREEYNAKYQQNNIFLMHRGEDVLRPYLKFYSYSGKPMLSADGKRLFFLGRENTETGRGFWYQFYIYSPDGKHRRITNMTTATYVSCGAVSPAGDRLAAVYDMEPEREKNRVVIYDVESGSNQEIALPDQPSGIINREP
jgi:Tol biopolymer transport system component